MKRRIRLTESDLHRMIKESVKQILRENQNDDTFNGEFWYKHSNEIEFSDHILSYEENIVHMATVWDDYYGKWVEEEYDYDHDYEDDEINDTYNLYITTIVVTRKEDGEEAEMECEQKEYEYTKWELYDCYEKLCRRLQIKPAHMN